MKNDHDPNQKILIVFLPSVVQVALYIALLPIMTFVLGPADYGVAASCRLFLPSVRPSVLSVQAIS